MVVMLNILQMQVMRAKLEVHKFAEVSVAIKIDPFRLFLQKYHTRKFEKGEIILVQGETPECTYVIKNGAIKTYNLTSHG